MKRHYVLRFICLGMVIMMSGSTGCGNQQNETTGGSEEATTAEPAIDRRSYDLGVIGAFAEMVGIGVKKMALSAPLTPEAAEALVDEAHTIAKRNKAEIYHEKDFLVTDLFPADITEGKHVLVIYTGNTKQEYLDLKAEKQKLVDAGEYTGKARENIARKMGALMSYPQEKIDEMVKE